jgi:5'-methylthioadenosine phosphorylase
VGKIKIAVIGGSGIYKLDGISVKEAIKVDTPFGAPSSDILLCETGDAEFYFLPRHGIGHRITPSEVNYRSNIFALKKLGVDTVISISAVGSLKEEYAPKDFVIVDQFIDWTKGKRERSFFDKGMVGHVSNAHPINRDLQQRLFGSARKADVPTHLGGTYICIEGPQFSTKAESLMYRNFGASIIGMTNVPEAFLAKEAGMAYATVAMVTDYDCWKEEHCTVQEIMEVMKSNYLSAQKFIKVAIPDLVSHPINVVKENEYAVVTDRPNLQDHHHEILKVILS